MLKGMFAALLVLSLVGKAVWATEAPGPDVQASASAIAAALRNAGFKARIVELQRSPGTIVEAAKGACRVMAGDYPVHGTFQDVYQQIAPGGAPLLFVHRGTVREREPKLSGLLHFYLWRELRRVGLEPRRAPVVAVAASRGCNLRGVPWEVTASVAG